MIRSMQRTRAGRRACPVAKLPHAGPQATQSSPIARYAYHKLNQCECTAGRVEEESHLARKEGLRGCEYCTDNA